MAQQVDDARSRFAFQEEFVMRCLMGLKHRERLVSFVPPGGNPTTTRTGRNGKPGGNCAKACAQAPSNNAATTTRFSGFMCTPKK